MAALRDAHPELEEGVLEHQGYLLPSSGQGRDRDLVGPLHVHSECESSGYSLLGSDEPVSIADSDSYSDPLRHRFQDYDDLP